MRYAEKQINSIRKMAGKRPYYQDDNITLYNMDCVEFMDKIDAQIMNLTITSPPYNIGKEYEKIQKHQQDYLNWCKKWLNQIYGITHKHGALWLNLGYHKIQNIGKAVPISYILWNVTPFYFMQEIVWYYKAGVSAKKFFTPRNEKYLWYLKDPKQYTFNLDSVRDPAQTKYPNQKKGGRLKCNPLGKNPTDVWEIPKITSGKNRSSKERTKHPAQFPLAVIDRIVKSCSNKNDILFDPFIGSGSVAMAGIANDRYVVGCDTSRDYLDIAVRRIKSANYQ